MHAAHRCQTFSGYVLGFVGAFPTVIEESFQPLAVELTG